MGLFDYVKYDCPCPSCGRLLTSRDWQTKEDHCDLDVIEPWKVKNFYAVCPGCKHWIDAHVDAEVETIVHKCEITLSVGEKVKIQTWPTFPTSEPPLKPKPL